MSITMWLAEWSDESDNDKRDMYLGVYGGLGLGQGKISNELH